MSEKLAERVAILEAEVAQLKAALAKNVPSKPLPWWREIAGVFANEPMYDEAMQLGREYRESLRSDSEETEEASDIAVREAPREPAFAPSLVSDPLVEAPSQSKG